MSQGSTNNSGLALPVAVTQGGTGVTSITANSVVISGSTSTSATTSVAPSSVGFVLRSQGASLPPTMFSPYSLNYIMIRGIF